MSTIATSSAQSWSSVQIASDGTACGILYDGSNLVFATASSPYSSWSGTTTISAASTYNFTAVHAACITSTDTIFVIYSQSSTTHPAFRKLTKSGSTWTVGSEVVIDASINIAGANTRVLLEPGSSRIWAAGVDDGSNLRIWYSDNSGTSWTSGATLSIATQFGGENSNVVLGYASASGSTYIVAAAADQSPIKYIRHLTSDAPGTWSSPASVGSYVLYDDHTGWGSATDATGRLMIAASPGNGNDYAIRTLYYNSGTDTWSSFTDIGLSTSDRWATLISNGTDIWCFWSAYSASNNYSLVYKKWTNGSATWDGSATTLVASGTNLTHAKAGYGSNTIGVSDTVGTSNPYSINFADIVLVTTSTRTVPATAALLQMSSRTVGSSAALLATQMHAVGASAALLATAHRTVPAVAALSGIGVKYNASLIVRSGAASLRVRSGAASLIVRE